MRSMNKKLKVAITFVLLATCMESYAFEYTVTNSRNQDIFIAFSCDSKVNLDWNLWEPCIYTEAWHKISPGQSRRFEFNKHMCLAVSVNGRDYIVDEEKKGSLFGGDQEILWAHPAKATNMRLFSDDKKRIYSIYELQIDHQKVNIPYNEQNSLTNAALASSYRKCGLTPWKCFKTYKSSSSIDVR